MNSFDTSKIKKLLGDKRFVTLFTGVGVCVIILIWYFTKKSNTEEKAVANTAQSLNANLPYAADSSGLSAKSKLQLAYEAQEKLDQQARMNSRGLNANIPGTIEPTSSSRKEVDGYIYGNSIPDKIYEDPDTTTRSRKRDKGNKKPGSVDMDDEEDQSQTLKAKKEETEKQKKLLIALQEYKADKERRQKEIAGRALKPEVIQEDNVSSLNGPTGRNGFFGLESDMRRQQMDVRDDSLSVTIKAMVFSEQTIQSGGRVSLRILEPIRLRGRDIPAGQLLYGVASFGGQRVNIGINSIQVDGRILPVKLTVFDMDGLSGIYVPNVVAVEQGRQSISQATQGVNISAPLVSTNLPASAAASAIQAGTQGVRSFMSRKVAVQKATLKNNYYVLLK